jgi:hypothetical protein
MATRQTQATETTPAPVVAQAVPTFVSPTAQFEKNPDQPMWAQLEKERDEKLAAAPGNAFQRATEQNIVFINAPGLNDQWIGVRPEEENYKGQPVSTFRIVPLNTSEALHAGRKVILPSGDTMVLPSGITSPDQIVHPETGERLMAEAKKK